MNIQCTKKLLEQLKLKPETVVEEDSLFSWHANLITVNRKKTVVLVNDQNRYVIVFHGLKAKDFSHLDELLLQGIRETFQAEGIKDEVIETYLLHSKEFTYTKTKNRTCVSRLNKACENVQYFEAFIENDSIINTKLSMRISRLMVGEGKGYIDPNEEMYKSLETFMGGPIFSTEAVQLKATLKLGKHQVWRRVVVPLYKTFEDLHEIFQEAFEWKDSHIHVFYVYDDASSGHDLSINHSAYIKGGHRPVVNLVCHEEAFSYPKEIEMKLETDIKLSEYIPAYKKLKYNYDFGDNWQHEIEVERIIDAYEANHAVCLEGEGNTPPEDVGGEHGYEEYLKILADPKHPDYQHMAHWGEMQGYKDFDIEQVNRMLRR